MSFSRYPAYKDSGVAWLGELPAHWNVMALKRIADVQTGVAKGKDHGSRNTVAVPYLRVANVQDGYLDLENVAHMEIPAEDLPRYALRQGDVLMNEGGDFDKLGRGHVWDGQIDPCITQNHVFAVRPRNVSSAWLNAITGSNFTQFYFMTRSKQSTNLASISSTNLMELPVILPPESEQQLILNYVADQTGKIDALVAEQRRLMTLLKEKRQAVITHAVTRGLNPDAPMKPSGIEWLGVVPAHWNVIALKRIADVQTGVAKGKDHGSRTTVAVPYLRVANVQDGYLDLENVATMEIPAEDLSRYALRRGDVLMNEGGDFDKLGRGHVWDRQIDPCITQNHVFAVRPRTVSSSWVNAITGSNFAQFYFMTRSKQSTNLASISSTNLMELPVILPPESEQQSILTFIADQTARFDTLTTEAQRAIDLLQERRTALISAAVTGQIDVRGAV
jgi:type I restriction enzyme S subunit